MKKYILFLIMILSLNSTLKAQNPTISTMNLNASDGDTVLIPINVATFTNVSSFLFSLKFDPAVLQWLNSPELNSQISTAAVSESLGTISMHWVGKNSLNFSSGTLINLKFIYLGGTSQLTFLESQSIVTDSFGNSIIVSYANGSIALKNYTLAVNRFGNGAGIIKVNGILHNLPYTGTFPGRSQVILEAVPDKQNSFSGWSGDVKGTTNPVVINMNKDKTVNAGFAIQEFSLTVNKTGNGQIKINDTLRVLPYSNMYPKGSQIKMEAIPDSVNIFSSWSGNLSGRTNPVIITMDSNKTIFANFSLVQYSLAVNFGGDGSGKIKVNGTEYTLPYYGNFDPAANVTVEAVPLTGSVFAGWSGDLINSNNPLLLKINGNTSIIANFAKIVPYTLAVDKIGNGQIKVNDTLRVLPFKKVYNSGTQVKIEAVPDLENVFTGWDGDFIGTTNPVIISMNGNKNINANFLIKQYTLTLTKTGAGDGQIRVNGLLQSLPFTGTFNSGTHVTLEAMPNTGNIFTAWSGDLISADNPAVTVINKNIKVNVNYDVAKYVLSIIKAGNGAGQIKVNGALQTLPFSATFNYNSNISIEAVADSNSKFVSWAGDLTGVTNPANITSDGNKTIQVNFNIIQFALTINKGGNGQLKVNGAFVTLPYSAIYNSGTKVTLQAVPDSNYQFIGWNGDLTGNSNPTYITINKDHVVTALFDVNIYSLTINKSGDGGGRIKVNGTFESLPYAGVFSFGSQIMVEAVPDSISSFSGWTGNITGNTNPIILSINGSKNIIAAFTVMTFSLNINKAGNGNGRVKVNGTLHELPYSNLFNSGSDITLEAVSSNGSAFTSWSGDLTGNRNPSTIKIKANLAINSVFSINAPDMPVMKYPGNNFKYISINPTLSWENVPNTISYHFQLSTDSSFSKLILNDSTLAGSSISVKSLQYKTKYFWRIRAKNSGGYSNFTSPWNFLTKIEPLGCPTNLRASTEKGKIVLLWNDNSANESGYQIFRKNGDSLSNKSYVNIGSVGKDINSFIDQLLNVGEIYTYLVYAYNSDTISCFSNQASVQAVTAVSDKQLPLQFVLFQNYPNPFNPTTKIVFDLPSESNVNLRVFDILGREVAVLIDNEVKGPGKYTINFDGSSLPSGDYFYLIRAGEFTAAKKFILLK